MDQYKSDILAGGVAVAGAYLIKKLLKKEVLPLGSGMKVVETFLVTLCSIGGKEAKKRIDNYQGPAPKP